MNILIEAAKRAGTPYALPPDPKGVESIDCSLYVLLTYQDAGAPFPAGVRTAQQIRQACTPIDFGAVQPGDLVFFEHTYEPDERPGPDGRLASHLGISLGTGTQKMWDANEVNGVGITSIATKYWQDRIFMAGRPKQVMADQPPVKGLALDVLHRARWEGVGIGYNPQTRIAACWREHPELGAAVSIEITLDDGRPAQAFAGGIIVVEAAGPRVL